MARHKQQRFAELNLLNNVLTSPQFTGHWRDGYFKNNGALILELACGHGAYTLALAQRYPHKNIIGVDIKGDRLWFGATQALNGNLTNVVFIKAQIEHLTEWFTAAEINEIWVTFPDPFPKNRQAKKRLTSPRFLAMYHKIIKLGGQLHLKTDDCNLFDYSHETLLNSNWRITQSIANLYAFSDLADDLKITTRYETKHLASQKNIYYLSASKI